MDTSCYLWKGLEGSIQLGLTLSLESGIVNEAMESSDQDLVTPYDGGGLHGQLGGQGHSCLND